VREIGDSVRVLARRGEDPVLLRQGKVLAATFHPELSASSPVSDLFVHSVRNGT
jgi:5'-phosphate synthase pdxT subunit